MKKLKFNHRVFTSPFKAYKCRACNRKHKRAFEMEDGSLMGSECFAQLFDVGFTGFDHVKHRLGYRDYQKTHWLKSPKGYVYWLLASGVYTELMRMVVYPSYKEYKKKTGPLGWKAVVGCGNKQPGKCEQKWFPEYRQAQEYVWEMMDKYMRKHSHTHVYPATYHECKDRLESGYQYEMRI